MPEKRSVIGWDIGGAHVKACLVQDGQVVDVAQWACPLWQGLDRLEPVLQAAWQRWRAMAQARHAITMTGEMVDLFADRERGVLAIADAFARALEGPLRFFAGDAGWLRDTELPAHWREVASANWLATARHAARVLGTGLLVDIGSTTTDLVALRDGRVPTTSRTDAQRLASGELAYHGVVRTPLCAVAHRIDWRGQPHNVMNEFFATSADVYRLTGELDPAHDLHPAADNATKDEPATQQRLARMIGLDARDGTRADWLAFARTWRALQVRLLAGEARRVLSAQPLPGDAAIVCAGCGAFLADAVAAGAFGDAQARRHLRYGHDVAQASPSALAGVRDRAQVCAPSVAVASLLFLDG
ncbi:hydantoinase/oxoprolinase family protein [Variovorax sp.]|uniref:hydantoinase/oxoprolinase family protein n=1 Tax=Variovorax sp. TaxID=1871043 RepID=UPI002D703BC4|nr:hydantoinase/oxoprolinase family protein [Variovorax sp.]HYP85346.1 hydantoinase/oxoprolinase family protein [Variovorax sp.]